MSWALINAIKDPGDIRYFAIAVALCYDLTALEIQRLLRCSPRTIVRVRHELNLSGPRGAASHRNSNQLRFFFRKKLERTPTHA